MNDNEEIENYGSEGSWFSGIVGWIIGFAVLFWIVGLFTPTKYEGQTAKNWFDEYDQCGNKIVPAFFDLLRIGPNNYFILGLFVSSHIIRNYFL